MKFELLSNEGAMASGGAGIQTAQKIANSGVSAIITGNVGPNAFQTLSAAGIKVIVGANGTVKESVEKYKKGELKEIEAASVGSHFGMGR
jgi:predicted Fe-Mo cluster-binding NifX family protein